MKYRSIERSWPPAFILLSIYKNYKYIKSQYLLWKKEDFSVLFVLFIPFNTKSINRIRKQQKTPPYWCLHWLGFDVEDSISNIKYSKLSRICRIELIIDIPTSSCRIIRRYNKVVCLNEVNALCIWLQWDFLRLRNYEMNTIYNI